MFGAEHRRLSELSPADLSRPELTSLVAELHALESHVIERRLACLAAIGSLADSGPDAATVVRNVTRRSAREAKKTAAAAEALAVLPAIARAQSRGQISIEHVDPVADVATRVSPQAADALVGDAAAMPADLFAKTARQWAARHEAREAIETRHQRQRRDREAQWWTGTDGMTHLHAVLDPMTGREVVAGLEQRVDQMWRNDGGRDGTPNDVRTPAQRRADALAERLSSERPAAVGSDVVRHAKPHPKHMVILHHHLKDGTTQLNDGTPVPDSVLAEVGVNAEVVGIVFGANHQPLYLGRSVRLANRAQWIALIGRDKGCGRCGAEPSRCDAHHLQPHSSGGPTNADNLELDCRSDHALIHQNHIPPRSTSAPPGLRKPRAA